MVLTGVVAAAAVARSSRVLAQWRRVPDLSRSTSSASVVAVVPARNEAATLPELLPALKGQVERVIVVDDASTDGTGDLARSFGADLVSVAGLADRPRPSWWLLLPAFNTLVFEGSPLDGRGMKALAIGHCILVRRKAFERAGGWETLAGTCANDVGIATTVRDSGGVPRFVDATALLATSGLDGFGQTWRSLRKSIVPSIQEITGSRARAVAFLLFGGVVHLLFGLAPVVAVLRRRSLLGAAAQAASHHEYVRRCRQPRLSAVLAPFSWAFVGAFLLDCAWRVLRGGTVWKDRRVG